MIYFPRNPRADRLYGFSPVEQIILTINTSIRRGVIGVVDLGAGKVLRRLTGMSEPHHVRPLLGERWEKWADPDVRHAASLIGPKPTPQPGSMEWFEMMKQRQSEQS